MAVLVNATANQIGEAGTRQARPRQLVNCTPVCDDDLTDHDLIAFQWVAGDQQVINKIIFEYDYDATAGTYEKMAIFTHNESVERFGIRPELHIQSQGLHSSLNADAFVETRAREIFSRFGDAPPAVLHISAFYRKHLWEVGDVICVSSSFIPNLVLGGRGLTDEQFEVVDCRPQFGAGALVTATLMDIEALTNQPPYTGVISVATPTSPDTDYVSELGLLGVSAGMVEGE